MTLFPGVYCFTGSAPLSGALTLDAQGDAGAIFVFQIATMLVAGAAAEVTLLHGAQANSLYWQVGTAAILGAKANFKGVILAQTSITFGSGSSLLGHAFAKAAVTLDSNFLTAP